MPWYKLLAAIGLLAGWSHATTYELPEEREKLQLLDASHWTSGKKQGATCLILKKPGPQNPPVRRPGEYALWTMDEAVHRFSVEALTLEPETRINRDICLIFGYQDETHFYYAHISSKSDNRFHNVIICVNGTERTRINREEDPEPLLTDQWHTLTLDHGSNGVIRVYIDDMKTPLMTAQDTTHPVGRVGFGTFDDRAAFDRFSIE